MIDDLLTATGHRSIAALERAVTVEQVRRVYQRVRATQWAMLVLAVAIALVFRGVGPPIYLWLGCHVALKAAEYVELRWFAADADIVARPQAMALQLAIGQAIHAAAWAALAPIALPSASPAYFIMVFMVMAGIASGSVTAFAPLFHVFTIYIVVLTGVLDAALLFGRSDVVPGYTALFVTIYGAAMWVKARDEAAAERNSILLTFTNAEFSRNLEREIARSEAAESGAVAANLAKTKFVAAASHDLRQPLAALGLFLGVLEQGAEDESQRSTTRSARAAFSATTEMLDALLDFSRAEAGVIVARPEPFRVADAFAQVERAVGPLADQGGLDYRTRASRIVLNADSGLVHIILLNLVSNAVRYTERGGVLIACRARGDHAWIEVWDTGIGIPAAQYGDIFREFHQLGNVERDRRKGLGLGLAIARRLADLIGADLSVASREGRGSMFRLVLPRAADVALSAPALPPDLRRAAKAARVLILDDDEAVGSAMRLLLEHWGHRCMLAQTIEEAYALVADWTPTVLICDLRLRGGRTGLDAVKLLRAKLGTMVPALLITGDTDPARLREAARGGLTVLHKPIAPEDLQTAMLRIA